MYTSCPDLEQQFGPDVLAQLLDRFPQPDQALDKAIADACEEIDGWLAARYQVPFVTVPPMIRRICGVIVRFNLWGRSLDDKHPDYLAYRDDLKTLSRIGDGTITLPAPTVGSPAPAIAAPGVQVRAPKRQFGKLEQMP